jgi:hypothetical protein
MTPNAGRLFSVRTICRLTDEMHSQSNAICAVGWSSARGQSRPGRADSRSGRVGFHPIATEFCVAAEFRDVPQADNRLVLPPWVSA